MREGKTIVLTVVSIVGGVYVRDTARVSILT